MADIIVGFLQSFLKNPSLIVVFVAMFPLIELKGAIPIGTKLGLNLLKTSLLSYVGSTIIIIPIFFLLKYLFSLLKKIPLINKLVLKIEAMFDNKAKQISLKTEGKQEKIKRKIFTLSLFIFVSIPLPLTGVWTGAIVAVFLGMNFKDSFIPLAVGNLVAGCLITLITFLFEDYVNIIINIILIIAIIMLIVLIVKIWISKPDNNQNIGR